MTYAVPASKASIKQNRFEFTLPGSKKKHSLPLFQYIPVGIFSTAFANPAQPNANEVLALFANLGVDKDALLALDSDQLFSLFGSLGEASGLTVGESSASTDD